ncbi:Serine protease SplB precursor [compost metagenome]
MKKLLALLLSAAIFCSVQGIVSADEIEVIHGRTDVVTYEDMREAAVYVVTFEDGERGGWRTSSGVFISGNYVLTNAHVTLTDTDGEVLICDYENNEFTGKVVAEDLDKDLALIRVRDNANHRYATIAGSASQDVISITNHPDLDKRFERKEGKELLYLNVPMSLDNGMSIPARSRVVYSFKSEPGNSGSPIFNDNGEIVALLHARIMDGDNRGSAVAINLGDIKSFVKEAFTPIGGTVVATSKIDK